jgi:uncharacterized membrane protein YuzA (DUF378 family)
MTDPMWTVALLAVLWLIVVVPMILRRRDERAGQRSVARFGASMRALSRRSVVRSEPLIKADESDDRPTVFVNGAGAVTRRPVPASEESLMYPPDQHEMSAARRQMMARRRRSLTILGVGSVVFLLLALVTGSALAWTPAILLLVGLGGYLLFLRSQARRDRERRQARRARSSGRSSRDYDATDSGSSDGASTAGGTIRRVATMESVVRIDDDDVSLDHLDTIDLTGLYSEVELEDPATRRRAG